MKFVGGGGRTRIVLVPPQGQRKIAALPDSAGNDFALLFQCARNSEMKLWLLPFFRSEGH
jgi:hypothetical protein